MTRSRDRTLPLTLPDFLIVGAMRSGTSSLARHLGDHPEVFMAPGKELHFFDLDARFELGLDWYASQFSSAPTGVRLGEATQTYMYLPHALERIAEALPGRRAIAILRDPVDRAYSHYWHSVERGREHLTFEEAVRAEPERLDGADVQTRLFFSYVDRGRYLPQLERLVDVFGSQHVLILLFEQFVQDARRQFSRVCSYLSVDDTYVPANLGRQINAYAHIRSPRLRRWAKPLPKRLTNAIGRMNSTRATYPELSPRVRSEVAAIYSADFAGLRTWPGLDISLWPSAAAAA